MRHQFIVITICFLILPGASFSGGLEHESELLIDLTGANGDTFVRDDASRALLSISVSQEFERWSWHGNAQGFTGNNGADISGDIQGISNIDAEAFAKVYELYGQYRSDRTQFICGKVDANGLFATMASAGGFIAPSAGVTPTISGIPTYIDPALSCNAELNSSAGFGTRAGIYAGDGSSSFDEQFQILELFYQRENLAITFGWWNHTAIEKQGDREVGGWYGNLDLPISQSLSMIATYAETYDIESEIDLHTMVGLTQSVWESNEWGVLYSGIRLRNDEWEKQYELYYSHAMNNWLSMQPVVQFINNAAGESRDLQIATLRLNISW